MKHDFLKTAFLSGVLILTPPVLDKAFAQTSGHTPGGEDQTEQVEKKIRKTGVFDGPSYAALYNSDPNPEDGTSVLSIMVATPADQKAQVWKDAEELLDRIAALPVDEPIPAAVFIEIDDRLPKPMAGAYIYGEVFRVKEGYSAFILQVMKDHPRVLARAYLKKKQEYAKLSHQMKKSGH